MTNITLVFTSNNDALVLREATPHIASADRLQTERKMKDIFDKKNVRGIKDDSGRTYDWTAFTARIADWTVFKEMCKEITLSDEDKKKISLILTTKSDKDKENFFLILTTKDKCLTTMFFLLPDTASQLVGAELLKPPLKPILASPSTFPAPQPTITRAATSETTAQSPAATTTKPAPAPIPPVNSNPSSPPQTSTRIATSEKIAQSPAATTTKPAPAPIHPANSNSIGDYFDFIIRGLLALVEMIINLFSSENEENGPLLSSKATSQPLFSSPAQVRPGLRGIPNGANNCFMIATFQMIMNDRELTKALVETYGACVRHYEFQTKIWQTVIEASQDEMSRLDAKQDFLDWLMPSVEYTACKKGLADAQDEYRKCINKTTAYKTFLTAEENYRTGKGPINLTSLRSLLAGTDIQGSKPGTTGDAEEFFNALFAEVQLNTYQIGFRDRFVRTYTPVNEGVAAIAPRTEIMSTAMPTLQVELPPLVAPLKNHNGQQLVDAIFAPKKNIDVKVNIEAEDGQRHILQTEQRFFQGAPVRLMVQLKRFTVNGKITDSVEMPDKLTIQGTQYNLKSIVQHLPGHYVAYIKKEDGWFLADDSSMTKADNLTGALNNGYLYFYERV